MVKPMKYRELTKRLREAGFTSRPGKGDHEKSVHPGIPRPVVITKSRDISPALTRKALQAIEHKVQQEETWTAKKSL